MRAQAERESKPMSLQLSLALSSCYVGCDYSSLERVLFQHARSPGFHAQHHITRMELQNWRYRQEVQEFKIILGYTASLKPTQTR